MPRKTLLAIILLPGFPANLLASSGFDINPDSMSTDGISTDFRTLKSANSTLGLCILV